MPSLARLLRFTSTRALTIAVLLASPACSLFVDLDDLGAGGGALDGGAPDDAAPEADLAERDDVLGDAGPAPDGGAVRGEDGDAATAPAIVVASDDFERTVATGFGQAVLGGAWRVGSNVANFSVGDGHGTLRVTDAGVSQGAFLDDVLADQADVTTSYTPDKVGSGSGLYLAVQNRIVGTKYYGTNLIVKADGSVDLQLVQRPSPAVDAVVLGSRPKIVTVLAGDTLRVRTQLSGRSPTVLRTKVWRNAEPEPAAWVLETSDGTPELQAAGPVGLSVYVSSAATNLPILLGIDDFVVRDRPLGR